ncbi:ionotropic glutamate receptor [Elysia marginata]|uniref:Ionotropic glutamate receptor n=1 Tax=Elysia marginata TaxID=1093978 RepID=A0AAV4GJH4_9GAST|nr:ionotropic glutamate receptor [Elysia marginata]
MGCRALLGWIAPVILVWIGCLHMTNSGMPTLKVGALFEKDYEAQKRAIEWAVERTNMEQKILPRVLVLVKQEEVTPHDSFSAQRKLCRMTEEGIVAMFGPISTVAAGHIQSVCNSFEIPHLQWRWDPRESREYFSISLYPQYLTLSRAYQDVIKHWEWKRFSVLYEHNEGELYVCVSVFNHC